METLTICKDLHFDRDGCMVAEKNMDIIQELVDRVNEVALTHQPDDTELFIELLTLQKELEVKLLEFDKLYRELLKSK